MMELVLLVAVAAAADCSLSLAGAADAAVTPWAPPLREEEEEDEVEDWAVDGGTAGVVAVVLLPLLRW